MAAGTIIEYNGGRDVGYAILFLLFTAYLFVGIAIASDIFMNAIEKICSATRTVKQTKEEDGVIITTTKNVLIWNDTVANLTLMALGSSAPEIMLSCIEISLGLGKQQPGELGAGTIVGSAAFNLFVISGLCICCLKGSETRRIKLYNVFIVTCVSSLFAYLWMVLVLTWITPDQVDLWEAIATLAFFPLLVAVAYWADQQFCIRGRKVKRFSVISKESVASEKDRQFDFGDEELTDQLYDEDGNVNKEYLRLLYHQLMEVAVLSQEEATTILATQLFHAKHHSQAWYRTKAARVLQGGATNRGSITPLNDRLQEVVAALASHRRSSVNIEAIINLTQKSGTSVDLTKKAVVEFQAAALAVQEAIGKFEVTIYRRGKEDLGFSVVVESIDGTARAGKEYQKVEQTIAFEPNVNEKTIEVDIIDNKYWNPDSNFYLKLSIPPEHQENVGLGQMRIIDIIIEDDEKPGKLTFIKRGYRFVRDSAKVRYLEVQRVDGNDGTISASWIVRPGPHCTMVPHELEGTVEFGAGEKLKVIEIPIIPIQGEAKGYEQTFDVELYHPVGGAKLGRFPVVTCAITSDENFKLEITTAVTAAILKVEEVESEEELTWWQQIKQSILPNDGDYQDANWTQWVMHVLVFPFKFTLAVFIPPPGLGKGYPCFILALVIIGFLTKFVGDGAEAFGKACGLDPVITAITLVALGTSLPDTFASVIAARNDKTADNAIGNVTGSNSVNVFLGLGLPWTIAALYYAIEKHEDKEGVQPFCVKPGTLTFNVIEFSVCAFLALCILAFRRYSTLCGKAELGGPAVWKWITAIAMIMLWFIYVALAVIPVYVKDVATKFADTKETRCDRIQNKK